MRRILVVLVLATSVLGLAACSNTGGNAFVPNSPRSVSDGSHYIE
jgi:UPF0716 family protein affecting phage T7 exclusion